MSVSDLVPAARPQRPVAGRVEIGEFGVDLYVDRAVKVDVPAVRWGDMRQQFIVHRPAFGPRLGDRQAVVLALGTGGLS
ncbi:hypothetical protein GCM10018773_36130 [Streptomyces candidus]|nr:hypothetical protein GCM10018773_36130 [Streptomyces candidus]